MPGRQQAPPAIVAETAQGLDVTLENPAGVGEIRPALFDPDQSPAGA